MNLNANASDTRVSGGQRGYAMAALLVAMGVMAVLMTVAMPTWKQTMRREREEELIFRGNQYMRAIDAYKSKVANAPVQTLDVLIEGHYLRKKYKDPMATTPDGEFALLYASSPNQPAQSPGGQSGQGTQGTQGQTGRSGQGSQGGQTGRSGQGSQSGQTGQGSQAGAAAPASTTPSGGGIIGVASKNKGESLRKYNDKDHYNEWQFVAVQQSTQGGGGVQGGPGRRARRLAVKAPGRADRADKTLAVKECPSVAALRELNRRAGRRDVETQDSREI
jgi:type II secretory pathway pseudopilin PulG